MKQLSHQLLMKELLCKGRSPLFLLMINDHTDRCRRQETIGNSVAVAVKHYLQVTDEHFEKAAQNAAQKVHEPARNDSKLATSPEREFNTSSGTCESLREDLVFFMSSTENVNGRYRTRTCDFIRVKDAL